MPLRSAPDPSLGNGDLSLLTGGTKLFALSSSLVVVALRISRKDVFTRAVFSPWQRARAEGLVTLRNPYQDDVEFTRSDKLKDNGLWSRSMEGFAAKV